MNCQIRDKNSGSGQKGLDIGSGSATQPPHTLDYIELLVRASTPYFYNTQCGYMERETGFELWSLIQEET
jgi:hypothetical protein